MGLKQDMLEYFTSIGMLGIDEASNWKYKYPDRLPYPDTQWRFPPEQSIFMAVVKKHFKEVSFMI